MAIEAVSQIARVSLCETLLGMMPKMTIKHKPYPLLRSYKLTTIANTQSHQLCLSYYMYHCSTGLLTPLMPNLGHPVA